MKNVKEVVLYVRRNQVFLASIGASSGNPLGYNRSYRYRVLYSLILFPLLKLGFVPR